MSFVLTEKKVYDYLLATLDGVEFPSIFSIILIDLDNASVEEEFVFPVKGHPKVSITFGPVEEKEESIEKENEQLIDEILDDQLI